ncbi:hypothetical protein B0H17DRAFT_1076184 [Mycena rosella]|uniref:Uncharacterized protein n=1 Tax=Mycena rosella TaxID=1033263 RepID=A0AAD7GCB7_MYCRO|nr:hypothetical protein B0H17DRAFT_1076184 [Mycena rosella]
MSTFRTPFKLTMELDTLNYWTLRQIPEPFFSEYANYYGIPVPYGDSEKLDDLEDDEELRVLVGKIMCVDATTPIRSNTPATIPVLPSHRVQYVDNVIRVRRRTPAEHVDPAVQDSFPTEELRAPVDDYHKEQQPPWVPPPPIMMDFVFPALGRRILAPTPYEMELEADGLTRDVEREPLQADYLGAMFEDLKNESEKALKAYTDAETALKNTIYGHECLKLDVEAERTVWKDLWAYVSSVSGDDFAKTCFARSPLRVSGKVPEDEMEEAIADG